MSDPLLASVIVPIAGPVDATETARSLQPHIPTGATVQPVHVVEKAGGAPDKASVSHMEEYAEDVFEKFRDEFDADGVDIDCTVLYGRSVVDTVLQHASDTGARSIAFTPRGGSWWRRVLTGDKTRKFVNRSDIPVLTFPRRTDV